MGKPLRPSEEQAQQERAARLAKATRLLYVRAKGTDVEFTMPLVENLPISLRRKIHQATGKSIDALGIDAVHQAACLWWVSRLHGGEDVALADVEAEWDERCAGVGLSDLVTQFIDGDDLTGDDDEGHDPEA